MNVEEEPIWRVIGSYFLIALSHLGLWVLTLCAMLGIPYWFLRYGAEMSQSYCGAMCGRGWNVAVGVFALVLTSTVTSVVLCGGILLNVTFEKRMKYIVKRVEELLPKN